VIVERNGDILQEIQREQGLSILLAEQNSFWALGIAHRAVIVELGRVTLTGAASDLAQDPHVRRAYLGV
jgi:branched-chain amino acid transport system ATP-binding protein